MRSTGISCDSSISHCDCEIADNDKKSNKHRNNDFIRRKYKKEKAEKLELFAGITRMNRFLKCKKPIFRLAFCFW
jgi:hypothetical protein